MEPLWKFRKMDRAEPGIDPVQGLFFNKEELGNRNIILVREAIQNSLDARLGSEPVRVMFSFGCISANEDKQKVEIIFKDLEPHLRASELNKMPDVTESLNFLAIEDFGTHGLQGNPAIYDDSAADMKIQDFYYFWRNIGRSKKDQMRLGRWGLGKQVFPALSRWNTFFGLTCRNDGGKTFLMGQSVLKVHHLEDGQRYFPYGWFGIFEGKDAFAMPVDDPAFLESFSTLFDLKRNGEPGLSVVVPFHHLEIVPKQIVIASIKNYFHLILSGDLVVVVRFEEKETKLTSETIREEIKSSLSEESEDLISMIDFSEWAIKLPEEKYEKLPEPDLTRKPEWRHVSIPSDLQKRLRMRFEEEHKIAIKVPVKVHKIGVEPVISWFSLFLMRDNSLQKGEAHFIRKGISITHANPRLDRGLRGLVLIENHELVSLLGDSEPPAHHKWNERSSTLSETYENGNSTVKFVKNSLQQVYRMILLSTEDKDVDLLKDIFYVDKSDYEPPDQPDQPSKKGGIKDSDPEIKKIPTRKPMIRVEKLDQDIKGFRIIPAPDEMPVSVSVKVAYMVRRGSPLTNYHPFDFDLAKGSISIEKKNVRITRCEHNELEVDILAHDFWITVSGFDENRDLFIRATPVRETSDNED